MPLKADVAPAADFRLLVIHYRRLMVGGLLRLQFGRPAKRVYSGSYISCDGRVL